MIRYQVELAERSYPIWIGAHAIESLGEELRRIRATAALIVTNTTVGPLYESETVAAIKRALPELPLATVTLPDGESYKDIERVMQIIDAAAAAGLDRKSCIVALGGGVVGDMAGFAASMWMRGIRVIQVPTTLLAQVDSSVGGKTGANIAAGKNLIGAFHQPSSVLIDPLVLKTLPKREVSAGIAEIVKYGVLGDAEFFSLLERKMDALRKLDSDTVSRVVAHCCAMKADIVRQDELEAGVRAKLNLGHTFGHAIEKLTGYGTWLHGEAVGAGMVMAAVLSRRLGYIDGEAVERIRNLVLRAGLPDRVAGLSAKEAYRAMKGDKKSQGGVIRFVVIRDIGRTEIETVAEEAVFETMQECGWN